MGSAAHPSPDQGFEVYSYSWVLADHVSAGSESTREVSSQPELQLLEKGCLFLPASWNSKSVPLPLPLQEPVAADTLLEPPDLLVRLPPVPPTGRSRQNFPLLGKLTHVVCRLPAGLYWTRKQHVNSRHSPTATRQKERHSNISAVSPWNETPHKSRSFSRVGLKYG